MGESYGNFDPLGKIAFLDQLEKIEEGKGGEWGLGVEWVALGLGFGGFGVFGV